MDHPRGPGDEHRGGALEAQGGCRLTEQHPATPIPALDLSLAGRVVLVTGASRGIGAATALAAAAAGAEVAVAYLDREADAETVVESARAAGIECEAFQADLSDPVAARRMVGEVERRFGRIDGLVNNAGIMPETPFLEIDDEEWDLVIRTDLGSAFACTQAALPGMLAHGAGSVVMVSSRLGQIGWPELAHYSAAKAGLLGLVKSLAREFGPRGVRVNAVAPGVTVTEMTRDVVQGETGRRRMAELPAGRFAAPDDVANTILFLLSDLSSHYYGQTLCPNGGGHMP